MKLIIAIVSNDDTSAVTSTLTEHGYYITRLSTTGGFLRAGNTTLLVGTDDEKVPEVIELIAELKEYLKTVECDYIGTYDAYFSFDYAGTTYKMDHSALSAAPDQLFTARVQIFERLEKFGAGNITYTDMWD